jgi:hypothetical protein
MLRRVSWAALGLSLAALSASPALAMANENIVVHVPFAFNVGDKTLPAGDYRVNALNSAESQVVEVRSTDGRYAALALTVEGSPGARGTQPEVVFDKYGTKEFLHAVRLPEEMGAVLEPSAAEREAARELTAPKAAHVSDGKMSR